MNYTTDQLNDMLRQVLQDIFQVDDNYFRPANQKGPTGGPDDPFCTILVSELSSTGTDERSYKPTNEPSNNIVETGRGMRSFLASINFYKSDAYNKAVRLKTLLTMEGVSAKLQAINFGLYRTGNARDLTGFNDADFEGRGQIDLEFYVVSAESILVPTFGTFTLQTSTESSTLTSEVLEP